MLRIRLQALIAIVAVGLAFSGAALAGGAPPPSDPPSPAARLETIRAEVADAEAAYRQAQAKEPDASTAEPERERLHETFIRKWEAGRDAAMEIAEADPASATGFDALAWILAHVAYADPRTEPALELVARHHATNPAVGKVVALLGYYPPTPTNRAHAVVVDLLKAVAEKNPDRTARGQAALGLAYQAKRAFGLAEFEASKSGSKDPAKVAAEDRAAGEAERAFEVVVRDYGDCPNLRSKGARAPEATLGREAGTELYELRHLRVGKTAPDLAADDLDGTPFKLSDYRGRVVLLVFWASWCAPCMAEVPHERELVERFKGRPFVLIGVNGDEDKRKAAATVAHYSIPWRSFWNGPNYRAGPMLEAYNVRGWPTVYVIDPKGVIRATHLRGKNLDAPLESLVAEAEAMKGRD